MKKATLIILAAIATVASGCSGMEVGGKFGVYRVDERSDSSRTYRQNVPLICYFRNCAQPAADEAQGS